MLPICAALDDVRLITTPMVWLQRSVEVGALVAKTAQDAETFRRGLTLLLHAGAEGDAVRMAARWITSHDDPVAAAREVFAALRGDAPAFVRARQRLLRFERRPGWRARRRAWIAGMTILVAMIGLAWSLSPAAMLAIEGIADWTGKEGQGSLTSTPLRFEVVDHLGHRSTRLDGDTVKLALRDSDEPLRGRTVAIIRGGVASFDSLYTVHPEFARVHPLLASVREIGRAHV